jgi:threonine synthase
VETISYEIAEQAAEEIDHVFVPAGGGGLTLAIARGFASQNRRGPRVHCVQPLGNDTIATPLRQGATRARSVECTTLISGLQVANVIDGDQAIAACRASGGTGYIVTDEAVWEMQRRLAQEEGIFCEPAGAVALAGAVEALNRGEISRHDRICCLVTGNGFKDIASLDRILAKSLCPTVDLSELEANPCSI